MLLFYYKEQKKRNKTKNLLFLPKKHILYLLKKDYKMYIKENLKKFKAKIAEYYL